MNNAASDAPDAEARTGLFEDPFADWANDDILFTKPARMALGARRLPALRVLDWPELRALFASYDTPANQNARRDRRLALVAVGSAAAGLAAAAFAPLAPGPWLGAAAAVLTLGGAGLAALHALDARPRARWLGARYWTERARALYFQTLINNLGLAAAAIEDDTALGEWKAARAQALTALPRFDDQAADVPRLAGVATEAEAWVVADWAAPPAPPPASASLELLFDILGRQRFDSQIAYAERKLGDSVRTPRRRSQALKLGGTILPVVAVAAAAAGGLLLALGRPPADLGVAVSLALAASACAGALALRLINDSLRVSEDAGRYARYAAAVMRARARFEAGDIAEKVAALREMEVIAYRDLREFVADHWRARHLM